MQFKINKISVKVSFSFLALILYFIITDNIKIYLITLLCATLHECVHIITIYLFKGEIKSVNFTLLGGNIKRASSGLNSNVQEAIVNISAPLFNIFSGLIASFLPYDSKCFSEVSLTIGLFNLLPFYDFDGGHFLYNILLHYTSEKIAKTVTRAISVIVALIFSAVSVYIFVFYQKNLFLLVFSLYMLLIIILKK